MFPQFPFLIVFLDFFQKGAAMNVYGQNVAWSWLTLCLLPPIYLGLYFYFDAIIPTPYGQKKSACFCLKKRQPLKEVLDHENLL